MNADQRGSKTKFLSVFIRVHPRLKLIFSPLNAGNFRASPPKSKTTKHLGLGGLVGARHAQSKS
jgi:hypothetical protein